MNVSGWMFIVRIADPAILLQIVDFKPVSCFHNNASNDSLERKENPHLTTLPPHSFMPL